MKLKNKEPSKPQEPLHTRMRPRSLDKVIGQDAVVKVLLRKKRDAHAYLFAGPSGTGKTTLGRLVAKGRVIEVDAATHTGIDAMRELVEIVKRPDVMEAGERTVIVDECHRLSRPTWDSLLKVIEEPPPHLYWVFCTTEKGKVPETIVSRCQVFNLKPIPPETIQDRLSAIAKYEGMSVPPELLKLAAASAGGSMRQAIQYLSVLDGVRDKDEALALMQTAEDNPDVIKFLRYLLFDRSRTWAGIQAQLKGLKESGVDAESVRIIASNYISACVLGARNEKDAQRLMGILGHFSQPYTQSDKFAPLILSTGNAFYS